MSIYSNTMAFHTHIANILYPPSILPKCESYKSKMGISNCWSSAKAEEVKATANKNKHNYSTSTVDSVYDHEKYIERNR